MFHCWHSYQSSSEDVSSVVGAPWEMWCPDDIKRDRWDWVGPPPWEKAWFNPPEWGQAPRLLKRSLPRLDCCCWELLVGVCCCCFGKAFTNESIHTQKSRRRVPELLVSQLPWVHSGEMNPPHNAQPSHSPQKKPYPEKRQLSIVWELAAPQDLPQNVYEHFVLLVSRILFLSIPPKVRMLGIFSGPRKPTIIGRIEAESTRAATPPECGNPPQVGFLWEKLAEQYRIRMEPSTSDWPDPAG